MLKLPDESTNSTLPGRADRWMPDAMPTHGCRAPNAVRFASEVRSAMSAAVTVALAAVCAHHGPTQHQAACTPGTLRATALPSVDPAAQKSNSGSSTSRGTAIVDPHAPRNARKQTVSPEDNPIHSTLVRLHRPRMRWASTLTQSYTRGMWRLREGGGGNEFDTSWRWHACACACVCINCCRVLHCAGAVAGILLPFIGSLPDS
jgi:hypothetical protein